MIEAKPIPGYGGDYSITFDGRVISHARNIIHGYEHKATTQIKEDRELNVQRRMTKPGLKAHGPTLLPTWTVMLRHLNPKVGAKGSETQSRQTVPRLLWLAWRGDIPKGACVRLITTTGQRSDIRAGNLLLVTRLQNRVLNNRVSQQATKDNLLTSLVDAQKEIWRKHG